jgi:hypothetical protein
MSDSTNRPTTHPPTRIRADAVYSLQQAAAVLGLAKGCLPREIRLGRLRVSKRAGRIMILGRWLLEWVESGELRPSKASSQNVERNGLHGP